MDAELGVIDPALVQRLPGLRLFWARAAVHGGSSSQAVRQRLARIADRINGAYVVNMREDTVPWAYRVLWHHIGLDPDVDRTPVEAAATQRLRAGGIPSAGRVADALTLAVLETGVGVMALASEPPPQLRPSLAGEALDEPLDPGTLVIADATGPAALVAGPVAARCVVGDTNAEVLLIALAPDGVARMVVEEAFWITAGALAEPA